MTTREKMMAKIEKQTSDRARKARSGVNLKEIDRLECLERAKRNEHFSNYIEWTRRHNGYLCLRCRKLNANCKHQVPKMLICVEDEIPKLTASKSRWRKWFNRKRFVFTDSGTLTPEQAFEIGK